MRFRFTSSLVLGLTIAFIGCSCCQTSIAGQPSPDKLNLDSREHGVAANSKVHVPEADARTSDLKPDTPQVGIPVRGAEDDTWTLSPPPRHITEAPVPVEHRQSLEQPRESVARLQPTPAHAPRVNSKSPLPKPPLQLGLVESVPAEVIGDKSRPITILQFRPLPAIKHGPRVAMKPTYSQLPMDNDASVLSELASSIDCGLVDRGGDKKKEQSLVPSDVGSSTVSRDNELKIVEAIGQPEQVQVLRLRATTPLDQDAHIPPKVSFKSFMKPVIVRHVHPEVDLPSANRARIIANNQVLPTFDEERLEASIHGLSSRPPEGETETDTIDR